ncbi:MAG: hypothetical protein GW859_01995, partial [Sphingomonadales bacterium]|nr:hypothetical protein [Sphingomonadales bacterium]
GARRAARRIARARRGESVRLSLRAGMAALALRPGDAVAVGDVAGDWRLAECEIDAGGAALTLAPAIGGERIANGGGVDPGAPVFEPDWPVPPTHWRFVDLPAIVAPRGDGAIHVVAAGTAPGWRGADVAIEGGWNEAGQAGSGSRA